MGVPEGVRGIELSVSATLVAGWPLAPRCSASPPAP